MSRLAFAANRMYPVTPSDSLPLTDPADNVAKGGYIRCTGTAGNIVLIDGVGNQRTYPVASGETITCYAAKVFATNTTATGLWCFAEL